jgi:hypothetical protein
VLFILTDQERYFRPGELPKHYVLPAHARLAKAGIMFENHEPVPADPFYGRQWAFELPESYAQSLDAPGRPAAHAEYLRSHDTLVGRIANEDWRWRARHNYYLNCLRDVDRNIVPLLDELESFGSSPTRSSDR